MLEEKPKQTPETSWLWIAALLVCVYWVLPWYLAHANKGGPPRTPEERQADIELGKFLQNLPKK